MKGISRKKIVCTIIGAWLACLSLAHAASASAPPNYITNGDFESGSLSGWTIYQKCFTVTNQTSWGGETYDHRGNYHAFSGYNGDAAIGSITSSIFTIDGGKYMDFLIGGGNDINNLYVALVVDGQTVLKATGNGSETYRRVIWDLSNYQNKQAYIVVMDDSAQGHIQVDDFHTPNDTVISDTYSSMANHDFESRLLNGWIVEGTAFSEPQYRFTGGYTGGDVTSDTNWWGGPFNHNGTYHLWGYKEGGDADTGVLKSLTYTLSGHGQVDFLIGGGNDINNLYVALVRASDGKILFKATGTNNEQYTRVNWDAAAYIGDQVYIKVVDNSTGNWGHVNIDDVNVQVKPKGLLNHTFEYGNLNGWTVVSGDAFSDGDVSNDTTWWGGSFNQDGTSHLSGFKEGGDGQVGVLKSENFVLNADGKIDFLISGGSDINNLYVALVNASTGAELMKATGSNSETYSRVHWDALYYAGWNCYIKVVDNATGSWGHVNLDDVNVQIQ